MTLPPRPAEWSLAPWDFYVERCGHREAEGETPSDAARNAEEDVRMWQSLGGDAAWVARLPPVPARVSPECLPLRRNRPR